MDAAAVGRPFLPRPARWNSPTGGEDFAQVGSPSPDLEDLAFQAGSPWPTSRLDGRSLDSAATARGPTHRRLLAGTECQSACGSTPGPIGESCGILVSSRADTPMPLSMCLGDRRLLTELSESMVSSLNQMYAFMQHAMDRERAKHSSDVSMMVRKIEKDLKGTFDSVHDTFRTLTEQILLLAREVEQGRSRLHDIQEQHGIEREAALTREQYVSELEAVLEGQQPGLCEALLKRSQDAARKQRLLMMKTDRAKQREQKALEENRVLRIQVQQLEREQKEIVRGGELMHSMPEMSTSWTWTHGGKGGSRSKTPRTPSSPAPGRATREGQHVNAPRAISASPVAGASEPPVVTVHSHATTPASGVAAEGSRAASATPGLSSRAASTTPGPELPKSGGSAGRATPQSCPVSPSPPPGSTRSPTAEVLAPSPPCDMDQDSGENVVTSLLAHGDAARGAPRAKTYRPRQVRERRLLGWPGGKTANSAAAGKSREANKEANNDDEVAALRRRAAIAEQRCVRQQRLMFFATASLALLRDIFEELRAHAQLRSVDGGGEASSRAATPLSAAKTSEVLGRVVQLFYEAIPKLGNLPEVLAALNEEAARPVPKAAEDSQASGSHTGPFPSQSPTDSFAQNGAEMDDKDEGKTEAMVDLVATG
eukprot:gnl/TRDRNA2_/TRDRNA2_62540_c0_seq1.p1 gnl/TRDRNA2_/TRDRNA2_62540_c0~~gnl/TRDRNA2_/TRDRNA2_62540_c0_seq1.p1  ORF type:complete len:669 (-),score=130.52 gnl/TRDRNA2_/TRDRNA2_62540_c0_seq1:60-2021(-)